MRKKLSITRLIAAICVCAFLAMPLTSAESKIEARALFDGIISFNSPDGDLQTWIDGALTEGAGRTSEWYIMALALYDKTLDFSSYADALEIYISKNRIGSAVTRQKYALALIACGRGNREFVRSAPDGTIGVGGIMSYVYGLHLLNNGATSAKYSTDDVVEILLSLKLPNGGWSITGSGIDIDVTSMAIQALAVHYGSNDKVHSTVDEALRALSSMQLSSGGFINYGEENPESSCQLITALASLGIEPTSDSRFIKDRNTLLDAICIFRLDDGSMSHSKNASFNRNATGQAFYSLASLLRLRAGLSGAYIFETAPDLSEPPEETESTPDGENSDSAVDIRLLLCVIICASVLTACLIMLLKKKKNLKSYIFVLALGVMLVLIVLLNNFSLPDDYYGKTDESGEITGNITLSIRCDSVAGEDYNAPVKVDSTGRANADIPADGVILPECELAFYKGDTVYDILMRAAKKYLIQIEINGFSNETAYISGINYLYEFDYGATSGWSFNVNGTYSSVGCGEYTLSDGDAIEWYYALEAGRNS